MSAIGCSAMQAAAAKTLRIPLPLRLVKAVSLRFMLSRALCSMRGDVGGPCLINQSVLLLFFFPFSIYAWLCSVGVSLGGAKPVFAGGPALQEASSDGWLSVRNALVFLRSELGIKHWQKQNS